MTFYDRFKSFDYAEKIAKYTYLTKSNTVQNNTFTFDSKTGIVHILTDTTKAGYIYDSFDKLVVGDIIEVACEVRSINGELPKISFDEYYNDTSYSNIESVSINKKYEWAEFTSKLVFRNAKGMNKARVTVGLPTLEAGEFQLRNLRINVKTQRKFELETYVPINKGYEIRKNNGNWEIRDDFYNSGGTVSLPDPYTIRITYTEPFTGKRPIPQATPDFFLSSGKYIIHAGNSIKTSVDIKIFDKTTDIGLNLDNVEEGTHFSLMVLG
ncbi:hypothetical protein NST86_26455 [Bacillus sp. FSL L8-0199]|uniref:hypothetical protein n=1 Tax=Bacillus sp. FSL L8-0199 TaxID=2954616 RepID=UPI0030F4CE08